MLAKGASPQPIGIQDVYSILTQIPTGTTLRTVSRLAEQAERGGDYRK